MEASNAEAGAGIFTPTFLGGSGFPVADAIVGNVSGVFWHLGNGLTGTWTQTLNGFQGGTSSAPVFLITDARLSRKRVFPRVKPARRRPIAQSRSSWRSATSSRASRFWGASPDISGLNEPGSKLPTMA